MRICLVSQGIPPETARGGIATQTWNKAEMLTRLGHVVHVLCGARGEGPELRTEEAGGLLVHRLQPPVRAFGINEDETYWLGYSWQVFRQLRALEQQYSFDLINFAEHGAEGYVYQLDRVSWAWTPVVVQLHGPLALFAEWMGWPEPGSDLYRVGTHMEEMTIGLADGLMASSGHIADFASGHYGIPRETIEVVHSGVDLELFTPDPRPGPEEGPPIVLFAGNVVESKGVVTVFVAVMRLRAKYPDIVLAVLGPDEDGVGTELRRRAAELGAAANLELLGFAAERAGLPQYYRQATVLCALSKHEGGVGNVYLEAMACGCPVIAADNGGPPEAIVDGETGFLVPARDVEATTAALDRVLGDAPLRRRLGEQARRHVEGYFGTEQYIGRVLTAYEHTIERSRERLATLQ